MRENWTTEPEAIRTEINQLRTRHTPLAFLQNSQNLQLAIIKATHQVKELEVLIVRQESEMENLIDECLFFYHLQGTALRGFRCQPLRKSNKLLGLKFPTEIFFVERRQNPRLSTPKTASAIFSFANRQLPINSTVLNLSLEGACLIGKIPAQIRVDTAIMPLTLVLFTDEKNQVETRIQIAEAWVVWSNSELDGELEQEFGITFHLTGKERQNLENYLVTLGLANSLALSAPAPVAAIATNPCK